MTITFGQSASLADIIGNLPAPDPDQIGRFFQDTDTGQTYRDDGAHWQPVLDTISPPPDGQIIITINGGGSVPTTGVLLDFMVPVTLTITAWTIIADQNGSIVIDLWRDSYAAYPPTIIDTQVAADPPTLISAIKNSSTALSGWTKTWTANDIVRVNIVSAAVLTRATLILNYTE